MRSFFIVLCIGLLFIAGTVYGQTWYPTNQATIGWDASTELVNGNPVPSDNVVKYRVWKKNSDGTGITVVESDIVNTQYTFTFAEEGKFFLGVSALRYSASEELLDESSVCWSDLVECVFNGETFGVRYYIPLSFTPNLRKQ